MGDLRNLDDERLLDELLAEFTEELRAHGVTNYYLVNECPPARQRELRAAMNAAALLYWAGERRRLVGGRVIGPRTRALGK